MIRACTVLVSAALLFGLSASASAQQWGEVSEVSVFPSSPVANRVLRITVEGDKADSCHRMENQGLEVDEDEDHIRFNIGVQVRDHVECSDVQVPFSVEHTTTEVPAGDYTLEVRVDEDTVTETPLDVSPQS